MRVEPAAIRVAKHVVVQHLVKVVETPSADYAIFEILPSLVVPIMQPSTIELVKDFLLFIG